MTKATNIDIKANLNKSLWTFQGKFDDQHAVMCEPCSKSHGWVAESDGTVTTGQCDQDLRCEGCNR
jgi:hypothetical protein